MKIKLAEVDKMIKEEFEKMMAKKNLSSKKDVLSKKLSQINEELSKMDSEDAYLNEVEAAGKTTVASHGWTGEANGDEKWNPKFEKKGTHLCEDDEEMEVGAEEEPEMGSEMGLEMGAEKEPEMGAEMSAEMDAPAMGEFESKFAELGKAIDAKLSAEAGEMGAGAEMGAEMGSEEPSDDDFEEVEVEEEPKEVDEYAEINGGEGAPHGMTAAQALEKPVRESVDEPLEGHSVVQDAKADTVNDNMEKDTHVKEAKKTTGKVIIENKKPESKNIFTEGVDANEKAAMMAELNRMKKFAGLSRDEE